MAIIQVPWANNHWLGAQPFLVGTLNGMTSTLIDASTEKIVFTGRFTHKDYTSKTITGMGWSFGAVTKQALATFKASIQAVDTASGPPAVGDGTPLQTISIANADTGWATDAWYEDTFDGAATRSLAIGEHIAVVFEFDNFVAASVTNIRCLPFNSGAPPDHQAAVSFNGTGSYVAQALIPNIVFLCDDGTYGTLHGALPCKETATISVNVDTAVADEYAIGIQFPYRVSVTSMWWWFRQNQAAAATEFILYSGTSALSTSSIPHRSTAGANVGRPLSIVFPPQVLAANTLYRISARPTGTTDVVLYYVDVNTAAHFQCWPGGTVAHLWTRIGQGAWEDEVTTRRLICGIALNGVEGPSPMSGSKMGGGIV